MKTLSGLVLDRYDDADRGLRNERVEAFEKTAHIFTSDELSRMPDETFAVIIEDGGEVLKKFSMADAGNLGLSIEYFMAHGHKLPAEAQKVAAANLLRGCGWYGVEPVQRSDLEKIAFGAMTMLNTALVAPGAVQTAKGNLQAVRGAGGIMTPEQIKLRRMQQTGV